MFSSSATCPYPSCTQELPAKTRGAACRCDRRQALASCQVCGIENRATSRFCRRCQAQIAHPAPWSAETATGRVNYLTLNGAFRRPPMAANGSVYAVNLDGQLETAWLKAGSNSYTLAGLPPAVGCNRPSLVNAPVLGKTRPRELFLGVHPNGVEAVVLNTGKVHTLHETKGGAELLVNAVGLSSGFRGVACDGNLFAFAERVGASQVSLSVRSLSDDRPAERSLTLGGTDVVGPAMNQGLLAMFTDEEVGVYDIANEIGEKLRFPGNFEPLMARRQGGLNIPPGTTPLTAERLRQGLVAYVPGTQNGAHGILTVELQTGVMEFASLAWSASITSNADGSLCIASEDIAYVLGNGDPYRYRTSLQFGMPSICEAGILVSFADEPRRGAHRVTLSVPEKGKVAELAFENVRCSEVSCGAPLITENGLAVPYFDTEGTGGSGLKLAFWDFSV